MRQQVYGQTLKRQNDGHDGARGIALSVLLSLPLWAVILAVGYFWLVV